MTATPAAGSHPAVDTLADLDADALEAAQAAEVRGHVDGCAACTAVLAALDRTRTDLRRLADPPLPSDVAAALDARLAVLTPGGVSGGAGSTVSGEVHPLRAPRRRRCARPQRSGRRSPSRRCSRGRTSSGPTRAPPSAPTLR